MFRKIFLILSGNAVGSLFLLIRNLLVARLIPVVDYGIAATFVIVMAVIDMTSQFGLQQQIIQARDGDRMDFQAALQGFQVLRGTIAGLVLFLAAGWLARLMNIPEAAWAYRVLALVPVLNALQHFDTHRMSRTLRFRPIILNATLPPLAGLVAVLPLAYAFHDYRITLFSLLVQFAAVALVSHLVAERPYRLRLDRAVIREAVRFGWPLLLNGMLLFAVMQGDKTIVGRELGMRDLAFFAMGVTLTLTPVLVVARSIENFFLPLLSREIDEPEAFSQLCVVVLQTVTLAAALLASATVLLGPAFVTLVLGTKYAALPPLLPLLAVMYALRLLLLGCLTVALSLGRTALPMQANLVRAFALPVAFTIAAHGGTLVEIIWVGIAGETVALALGWARLRDRIPLPSRELVAPHVTCVAVLAAVLQIGEGVLRPTLPVKAGLLAVLCSLLLLVTRRMRLYFAGRTAAT